MVVVKMAEFIQLRNFTQLLDKARGISAHSGMEQQIS